MQALEYRIRKSPVGEGQVKTCAVRIGPGVAISTKAYNGLLAALGREAGEIETAGQLYGLVKGWTKGELVQLPGVSSAAAAALCQWVFGIDHALRKAEKGEEEEEIPEPGPESEAEPSPEPPRFMETVHDRFMQAAVAGILRNDHLGLPPEFVAARARTIADACECMRRRG